MQRIIYKDEKGKVFFDETYFTAKELKNAAICMFNKQHDEPLCTVKEIYETLRYLLGIHYWTCDFDFDSIT